MNQSMTVDIIVGQVRRLPGRWQPGRLPYNAVAASLCRGVIVRLSETPRSGSCRTVATAISNPGSRIAYPDRLMQIINLYQAYADAAVLSGQDRGERSGRQGSEDAGFF